MRLIRLPFDQLSSAAPVLLRGQFAVDQGEQDLLKLVLAEITRPSLTSQERCA
jgi:hypothetical protein